MARYTVTLEPTIKGGKGKIQFTLTREQMWDWLAYVANFANPQPILDEPYWWYDLTLSHMRMNARLVVNNGGKRGIQKAR